MDDGEIVRAVEFYALAGRYPLVANNCWFDELVGKHITVASASLPSEILQAAQKRGGSLDLWQTAQELVRELIDDQN